MKTEFNYYLKARNELNIGGLGKVEVLESIITEAKNNGFDILRYTSCKPLSLIHVAVKMAPCYLNNLFRSFIKLDANLESPDEKGQTVLYVICNQYAQSLMPAIDSQTEITDYKKEESAEDAKDLRSIIEMLVKANANVNTIISPEGKTPLDIFLENTSYSCSLPLNNSEKLKEALIYFQKNNFYTNNECSKYFLDNIKNRIEKADLPTSDIYFSSVSEAKQKLFKYFLLKEAIANCGLFFPQEVIQIPTVLICSNKLIPIDASKFKKTNIETYKNQDGVYDIPKPTDQGGVFGRTNPTNTNNGFASDNLRKSSEDIRKNKKDGSKPSKIKQFKQEHCIIS